MKKHTPFDFWVLTAPEQEKVHCSLRISEWSFHPYSRNSHKNRLNKKKVAQFTAQLWWPPCSFPWSWRQITRWRKSPPRKRPWFLIGLFLHSHFCSQSAGFLHLEEKCAFLYTVHRPPSSSHRRKNGKLCLTRTVYCAFVFVSYKNVLLQTGDHRPWNTWSRIGHGRSCFVYNSGSSWNQHNAHKLVWGSG